MNKSLLDLLIPRKNEPISAALDRAELEAEIKRSDEQAAKDRKERAQQWEALEYEEPVDR